MINSRYKLKTGEEVAYFPPIQNTANPYLTEAAMHADQANQLEGYGYLVDGAGAFTYLGTLAGTASDYKGFGANLRLANLAADLSTAEKDAIRLKIGTAISPAPFLDEVIPDSYLPSTTGMFKLKGSFFTENMTVSTAGGTVNYITFNNDNDVDVNITTGATEGSFSVTIDNGISKTFDSVLLIILGTVYKPTDADWINKSLVSTNNDAVELVTFNSQGTAEWTKQFDYTRDWTFRFNAKKSPLGTLPVGVYNVSRLQLKTVDGIKSIFDYQIYKHNSLGLMSNSRSFNDSWDYAVIISNYDWELFKTTLQFELRYLAGVLYVYVNNTLGRTHTDVLNQNLKLIVNPKEYDFENIKYIETV